MRLKESFNWLMTDSQGQASDYMKSLLHFLNSNLDSFKHIPVSLLSRAYAKKIWFKTNGSYIGFKMLLSPNWLRLRACRLVNTSPNR